MTISWQQKFKIIGLLLIVLFLIGAAYLTYQNIFADTKTEITEFKIIINKIGVEQEVIPDVDPRNKDEYKEAFKEGVAHGLGTKLPGDIGNVYLFAHSTKNVEDIEKNYGWFTRLDELKEGDTVQIIFNDTEYTYTITSYEIVNPKATGVYTSYAAVPMLTLQTCYPRGEITNRIIYKAVLVDTKILKS